ncbi:DASH family cryptochrome [Alcanivorax sp. S6407]|uniref:DASH family cryptochrome n=1 Tax=Alcanivorax sp. S6407 TaxID=2926424 RepID=UPI001FF6D3A2|nr:DASH family cryptochrome [Alcanivorax sp. S6407]MCK0154035.1 DASH family cryptochrome [Alcanivorax sp. S6407]
MITVVWFRHDLRVQDQPLLHQAAALGNPVLPLYVLPEHWTQPGPEGINRLGPAKAVFLQECLADLAASLDGLGLTLNTALASPAALLCHWHQGTPLQVVTAEADAPEEQQDINALRTQGITVHEVGTRTLLSSSQLPWEETFPATFSRFRKKVERRGGPQIDGTEGDPRLLPAANPLPLPEWAGSVVAALGAARGNWQRDPQHYFSLSGGEQTARQWLQQYLFEDRHLRHYKTTRNQLIGTGYSSRLSAALAWGCLSVRHVWHAILDYEQQFGGDQHSYWLRFELLWREFFHWSQREYGAEVFRYTGLQLFDHSPLPRLPGNELASRYWQAWCAAETGLPFIDANLKELLATGYLSNRGRQNLASFLVHDLGLDWRRGARWFEHHLVDHDVASNWGNWAYIVGVGHDAQGGRRFSPTRQWWRHDPEAEYVRHWLPVMNGLSRQQILKLHFAHGNEPVWQGYPAAIVSLPESDREVS